MSRGHKKAPALAGAFGFVHLASFDLDLLLGLDGLELLRKPHREYAILEACFDLVGVDALREREVALEGTDMAFMDIVVLLLLLLLFLPLALDRQAAFGELHLNILLVNPRKICGQLIGVIRLDNVDSGSATPFQLTPPERVDIESGAPQGGA